MQPAAVRTVDETNLVFCAQQGDRQAYGELVIMYRESVVGVVYRMCGDAQVAEDAAQEAFIRAWQHIRRYQPRASFRSWVYRIAVNAALDVLRREKPSADIEAVPLAVTDAGPLAAVEAQERAQAVQQAVLGLPPASRTVLILREYQGLSYQEIADALDIPSGTVMSRLNYARKHLQQTLARYLEEPV